MGEINTVSTGALGITRELVDQVYDEVLSTEFRILQREEMGFAQKHDPATFIVYGKVIGQAVELEAKAPPAMTAERAGRGVGFLAAHRLLRTAANGPFTELKSSDALIAYYDSTLANPGRLEADFRRDWGQQDAVMYLVDEKLTKTDSRFGSKLLLVIHGRLANPNQPRFRMPTARETYDSSSRGIGISLPQQGTRNNHEAQAQLLRSRRIAAYTGGGRRFN